ncbi:MAG: AAA family ATPase [Chloroflexi bacterium]|nr:AAA family ATPase [Chloroflexota bacterium]
MLYRQPLEEDNEIKISSGSDSIDRAMFGGLPIGSFTLIEGPSGTGKSVLAQHLAFGALLGDLRVCYYVENKSREDLVKQMASLSLDVAAFLPEGRLSIYPLYEIYSVKDPGPVAFEKLQRHIGTLPPDVNFIIVDSLNAVVSRAKSQIILTFFMKCKQEICEGGKAVLFTLPTSSFDPALLPQMDKLFDTHLSLHVEGTTVGLQLRPMKVMDIMKVRKAQLRRQTSVYFEVDPELGRSMNMSLKVLPFYRFKA